MKIFSSGWSDGFDGPGRRWVVYLKGCDFRCRWCANPEGLSPETEILFRPKRGVDFLDRACPHRAVGRTGPGGAAICESEWSLDRERCAECPDFHCARVGRHDAFELAGEEIAVGEVVDRAVRSKPLFDPDGGVTFGGGEPTLQAGELKEALAELRKEGIHTAVETNAGSEEAGRFIGLADLLICDLKCLSLEIHRRWTGAGNEAVLENLREAARRQPDLIVRVTLVTGMNDSESEMDAMAGFLAELAEIRRSSKREEAMRDEAKRENAKRGKAMQGEAMRVEVLRFHHLGEPKYAALGIEYPMAGAAIPGREMGEAFVRRLGDLGLDARLGA